MDINEISKVANRKRLNSDAEKLREKVSREAAKIIKLKVAQDTAYWDLKEKLHQVEGNHERLQQNMVEVQMQHEAISGQYQDELRLRPDTLNKLSSTREICDVLEDYSERLKETLARCKADQASLCEAYQKSGQVVRELKLQHTQLDEKNRRIIESLEEKANLTSQHQNQMIQYLKESKQKADTELNETRVRLASTQAQKEEFSTAANELSKQLELIKQELYTKDTSIVTMQKEMKQLLQEFNSQSNEMKCAYGKKENDLKDALDEAESLKRALSNQEAFTDSIRKQNDQLQEQLAAADELRMVADQHVQQLKGELEVANVAVEKTNNEIIKLQDKIKCLQEEIEEKLAIVTMKDKEINTLQMEINNLEAVKAALTLDLEASKTRCDAEEARATEMSAACELLQSKLEGTEAAFKNHKDTSDAKIVELVTAIKSKDTELDSKTGTIAQLMCEVTTAVDTSAKLETALHKLRRELEAEKDSGREKDRKYAQQVERLEGLLREKDDELSKQISIILEIRAEKERLQEKFQNMQNTMDSIQKQLAGPLAPPPPREAPEHDDNARPFVSQRPEKMMTKPTLSQRKPAELASGEPKHLDSMLFSLFSDNSMDDAGNMLDPREMNRRIAALSPAVGRRGAVPTRTPRYRPDDDDDNAIISLSQVKNNLKNKDQRTFFKTKRDVKTKKAK